jgi:hypothetical protein
VRNNISNDNLIDDCEETMSEESFGFVQEWINTYVFLSRELSFFSSSFQIFLLLVFLSSCSKPISGEASFFLSHPKEK